MIGVFILVWRYPFRLGEKAIVVAVSWFPIYIKQDRLLYKQEYDVISMLYASM